MSKEVEASWDQPHTLQEVPGPFPGVRHHMPSVDPEITQIEPPPSWI